MIVDASAVIAIALMEPDAARYAAALRAPGTKRMSVVNYWEAAVRLDGGAGRPSFDVDAFLAAAGIDLAEATPDIARAARAAHRRFGKGRHPAGLNLGDCFAYALATVSGAPLLFKGADFARTDVRAAL